jgi:hypothetical protein
MKSMMMVSLVKTIYQIYQCALNKLDECTDFFNFHHAKIIQLQFSGTASVATWVERGTRYS